MMWLLFILAIAFLLGGLMLVRIIIVLGLIGFGLLAALALGAFEPQRKEAGPWCRYDQHQAGCLDPPKGATP